MKKHCLLAFAASAALIPGAALAQAAHPAPMPGAGHRFHQIGPNMTVRHQGPVMGPGMHFPHQRLHRGFFLHPFFFGPQFHVQNWPLYGFGAPGPGQRWVRYYGDAYLIGPDGRVMDERYGLDWDQYGERWDDDDGIPHYEGSNDWRPGERDHAWVEQHGGHYADGQMAYPGYGYGYYGGGMFYPAVIIETTTTTGPAYVEEVVEEVVRRPRHRARARCDCAAPHHPVAPAAPPPPPRPRPPAGERG